MLHFFVTPFWIVCVHIFASFDTLFVCTFLVCVMKCCVKMYCYIPISVVYMKNKIMFSK